MIRRLDFLTALAFCSTCPALVAATYDYRVLATTKTSTMEKELNEAAVAGFVFADVMGGQTAFGGKEVVVVMQKDTTAKTAEKRAYKLLATSSTATMQKEIQQLGDEGFDYKGQSVFESALVGREVVVIMERTSAAPKRIEYKLLATSKTSTMQKELKDAGDLGFRLVGMTVAKTAFGGSEVVCILRKN